MKIFTMKILLISLVSLSNVWSDKFDDNLHPFSDEFIEQINNAQSTWKAGRNFDNSTPLEDMETFLGVLPTESGISLPVKPTLRLARTKLPDSFDAREKWYNCPSIGEIRDQSTCASCWAFAAVEAMTDRICIRSKGKTHVRVSAADLISCCRHCGNGCRGGHPNNAWRYWKIHGIVSGGAYNSNHGCKAFFFPPCEHAGSSGSNPRCKSLRPTQNFTPACRKTCDNGSKLDYRNSLTFGKSAYRIRGVNNIQYEIFNNGPVEATFTVHADFFTYKTGVYKHVKGRKKGRHAIKILGWGEEKGTPFWLAANSWNPHWGDKGFLKILRGKNECGIESTVVAGIPLLKTLYKLLY